MARRIFSFVLMLAFLQIPVHAETIRWVDFSVPEESLQYAMDQDILTYEQENHISWIDILAVAACRSGGKCDLGTVKKAYKQLKAGETPEKILGKLHSYYAYYREAYGAVLGGLLGTYSIEKNGDIVVCYGLKAFSPIAEGYGYSHCPDFGNSRSFGFNRKHRGNDIMGAAGTPIVAVEGGVVEAMGWNPYGGWRIGVRSFDSKRYYYYAHFQKDHPYADGLKVGDVVEAGDLLGFMGRTGYSQKENVNNITRVHLHFGMQLIFEESQKECNSEIWIDVYPIVKLLQQHRSTLVKSSDGYQRAYPYEDLDSRNYP